MAKDKLKAKIKGRIEIYRITNSGRQLILERDNAITADAPFITIRSLGDPTQQLATIKALKSPGVNLATAAITGFNYPGGSPATIEATALFSQASFNDTLDELNLVNAQDIVFSEVTGLNITKDSASQLQVIWKLSFQNFS